MFHPRKSIAGIKHPREKRKNRKGNTPNLQPHHLQTVLPSRLSSELFQIADVEKWKEMEHGTAPFAECE